MKYWYDPVPGVYSAWLTLWAALNVINADASIACVDEQRSAGCAVLG